MQPTPHTSPEIVDAQISRCAEARSDVDRLKAEVDELKALAHPRAAFAAALFELDRARKGDPDARASILDVADSLLAFWKDKSGSLLASSHPALEELWSDAVKLLSGFHQKRFQRQLDGLWEARADARLLAERVAELGQDDDPRAEFARCLYHLELARQSVDGSRVEFARRAALLHEAYLEKEVADELVGGDQGLAHLWGELIPYLDEFFETLEDRAAEARAAALAQETGDTTHPEGAEPAVTAPPPAATPGDGHLPLPVATPYVSGEHSPGQATLPPGTRFPAPRDTAPPPHTTEPQTPVFSAPPAPPPMPPAFEPGTAPQVPVVTAPIELPETPDAPAPRASWADDWAGVSSLRSSSPEPPRPAFDAAKTAPVMEAAPPLPDDDAGKTPPMIEAAPPLPTEPQHITQPIEVPEGEVLEVVEELSTTLPPDRPPPPPLSDTLPPNTLARMLLEPPPPPPNDTIPPDLRQTFVGVTDSETLDPDLVAEAPPPLPRESVPPQRLPSSPALEVVEDDEPEPGPVTQAFWRGTEVALGLLPPADAPRVNTRVFAADHRNERKKLTNYLEDVKTRFTEAEVPESRAFQCLLKLYLAAHLKEKTLFGQKNEKRAESFREALMLLGRDPMAAAHCAVWFELDGPRTLEKLNDALEVLADYLQFCARENLDPLAPTSPALFL